MNGKLPLWLLWVITILVVVVFIRIVVVPASVECHCAVCPAAPDTVVVEPGDTVIIEPGDTVIIEPGDSAGILLLPQQP
jgi:hypothetical protein